LAGLHEILYQCNRITPATGTALVSTALLTLNRPGSTVLELQERVKWIWALLKARHARIIDPLWSDKGKIAETVDKSLRVLSRIVPRRGDMIFGWADSSSLELGMYRNSLTHWFIQEGIVCVSMVPLLKGKGSVSRRKLFDNVRNVSELLKMEFIFKPGESIFDNFLHALDILLERNVVKESSKKNSIMLNLDNMNEFRFLCMLVWPHIETYWIVARSLGKLLYPEKIYQINQLSELILKEAATLFYSAQTTFFVQNSQAIKHTFGWFRRSGFGGKSVLLKRILTIPRIGKVETITMLQLTSHFKKSLKALDSLVKQIATFRPPLPRHNQLFSPL